MSEFQGSMSENSYAMSEILGSMSEYQGQMSKDEKTYLCTLALFSDFKAYGHVLISADIILQKNI